MPNCLAREKRPFWACNPALARASERNDRSLSTELSMSEMQVSVVQDVRAGLPVFGKVMRVSQPLHNPVEYRSGFTTDSLPSLLFVCLLPGVPGFSKAVVDNN